MCGVTEIVADRPTAPDYREALFAGLNEAQCRAVEAVDGAVLVLAGAGTGKTRVLTTRLAHILAGRRAYPGEMLAVTFTNKASREMRERLEAMIGRAAEGVWLGTFHALAARILRRHAEAVGLTSNFTILDTDDQLRLLKQLISAPTSTSGAGRRGSCCTRSSAGRTAVSSRTRCRPTRPGTGPTAAPWRSTANTSSGSGR